jgi:hypothetical protein
MSIIVLPKHRKKPWHCLETIEQCGVEICHLEMLVERGIILYWNMANVQPKQIAKHFLFCQIEVLRPSLMALDVRPELIPTILTMC